MNKILLIDSDYQILDNFSRQLDNLGYQVYIAQDGNKGLELAKMIVPEVMICEINLPRLDGFGILEELNKSSDTAAILSIFTTAKYSRNEMHKAMEMGVSSYLERPIDFIGLHKIIKSKLEKIKLLSGNNIKKTDRPESRIGNSKLKDSSSLMIEIGNATKLIKLADVEYLTVHGNYTYVYVVGYNKVLVRKSLKAFEEILPEEFIRIHRSTIININLVSSIEKWYNRIYKIHMYYSKEALFSSKRYTIKIKSKLKI